MKRSLFKIGRFATLETRTGSEVSKLECNITEWLKDENSWDLTFNTNQDTKHSGTIINITDINSEISGIF